MIPDSLAAFVSFLLLLAPGITWQLQQARHEPAVKETTLVEISRVVIASLLATGTAALVLLPWLWLPLYRRIETDAFPLDRPAAIAPYVAAVAATALLACGLTLILAAFRWPRRAPINRGRQWNHVFVTMKPAGSATPYLTVELLDDTVWKGELVGFDTDPEDDQRGLTLGPPLRRKRPGAPFQSKSPDADPWRVVVLPESQIKSIQVQYPPQAATPTQ